MSTSYYSNITKTATAALIGLTAVFMLGVSALIAPHSAHAQTKAELEERVSELLSQVQNLQAQMNNQSASKKKGCSSRFSQSFSVGDTGPEVKQLQQFLNAQYGITVAQTGPGSNSNETQMYGNKTAAAVSEFQENYSEDVLAPVGLSSGTGYWGAASRAKANEICDAQKQATSERKQTNTDQTQNKDNMRGDKASASNERPVTLAGSPDAFVTNYDLTGTPSSVDLDEGETKQVVGAEFDIEDGDVLLQRVDPVVEAMDMPGNGGVPRETEPWEIFESMSLYLGEKKLATIPANSPRFWNDEGDNPLIDGNDGTDEYSTRFSGMNIPIPEGENHTIFYGFTIQDNLDSADIPQTWGVGFPQDTIRFRNGAGVDIFTGEYLNSETFTVEESDTGTLTFKTSPNEKDERVVEVDDTTDTDDVELLTFEVEAEEQEVLLEDVAASTTVNGAGNITDVASTLHLFQGDTLVQSENISASSTANETAQTTFDDVDLELPEDEDVEMTIAVDLEDTNDQQRYTDGVTINTEVGDVNFGQFNAEELTGDGDNITQVENNNPVTGELAHLFEVAPQFTLESTSVSNPSSDDDGNGNDIRATYNIKFSVEADEEDDIFVPFYDSATDESIVASTTDGNNQVLSNPATSTITISESSESDSSVDRETDGWEVPSGTTGVFTVSLKADNDNAGSSRFIAAKVESLKWSTTTPAASEYVAGELVEFDWNLEDWETEPVSLDN